MAWIYNKANKEYGLKWNNKWHKIPTKLSEMDNELLKAFFGYGVSLDTTEEAKKLFSIMKQRWAISGTQIENDEFLSYNEPNSQWVITDTHEEMIEILQPKGNTGGNAK